MIYGLTPLGTKLENGKNIKPIVGHIKLNVKIENFENCAKATFVSPSIFYADYIVYVERIMSSNERFFLLLFNVKLNLILLLLINLLF